ncbi:TetR/AcrR family transcriptional regulator [Nonomuraea jiangxiensis]|uniref:DNA-binding transcriptional regulator, AcrR family n=1 Tax=Nonomuraea jiangxiensis TaxID=633440 RepID=A0A1G8QNV4_9ACTN|nr:TetR/AcrR family transcriptional regulator [Nonomuraea jiangxiensis]SDJ06449.1 DNA-binding transcriptional regulator, AcrR family [Nonomuraea jiangxiensis]
MTPAKERDEPVRADARRNRAHLIEVARDVLTASSDASLNSIAKRAGVGPGTLYRHFPTREDLIVAVYLHEVEQLAAHAPELLRTHPPLEALRRWLDRLAYYGRIKHGLAGVLHALTDERLADENYRLVIGALTALLDACKDGKAIRPDADPDDVLLLLGFLWRVSPGPEGEARATRLLDLVIDGLRHGAAELSGRQGS